MPMEEKMLTALLLKTKKQTLTEQKPSKRPYSGSFRQFRIILNFRLMKAILHFILLLIISVQWSCEKAIDLKLKDNVVKYVIEGAVTNEPGGCRVNISETKEFGDDNQFNGISGAVVKIENKGNTIVLRETGKGIYETAAITGVPGETYNLTINILD